MQPNNNFPNQNNYIYQQNLQGNPNININRPPQTNYYNPIVSNNGFLSPQAGNHGNYSTYSSTIQTSISPSNKPSSFGSNKLSSMGRFIKD
jgi:hypothetical protein